MRFQAGVELAPPYYDAQAFCDRPQPQRNLELHVATGRQNLRVVGVAFIVRDVGVQVDI